MFDAAISISPIVHHNTDGFGFLALGGLLGPLAVRSIFSGLRKIKVASQLVGLLGTFGSRLCLKNTRGLWGCLTLNDEARLANCIASWLGATFLYWFSNVCQRNCDVINTGTQLATVF